MARLYRIVGNSWQKPAFRYWLAIVLAAVAGVAFGKTFLNSVSVVQGSSMAPNYPPGTMLCTTPISAPLQRGDVVLLDDGKKDYAVKRIIGLPGETVHLWRGFVFINREMLVEPYLPRRTYTYPGNGLGAAFILGEDQYFLLGDNRLNSTDSRAYGAIERKQIKRLIPLAAGTTRAHFAHYTIKLNGKDLIQPM